MKFLYFILLFIFSLYFVSCASASSKNIGNENEVCFEDKTCNQGLICVYDKCVEDKCLKVECDKWVSCNPQNGKCDILNEGFCLKDTDCNTKANEYCDNHHKCVVQEVNPCDDEPCKDNTEGKIKCVKYSNDDGYICMEPENSNKCEPNPCKDEDRQGLTKCVLDGPAEEGYYCTCEDDYVFQDGQCIISCDENCEEKNMTCQVFHNRAQCIGGIGAESCIAEQMVKINASGVWIGTTDEKDSNYEAYCDGTTILKGGDLVYSLKIYEDNTSVSLTLEFNDENASLALPSLAVFNENCKLLDNSLAENVCVIANEDDTKISLDFERTIPGIYYIVIDSVNNVTFDYALIVDIQ